MRKFLLTILTSLVLFLLIPIHSYGDEEIFYHSFDGWFADLTTMDPEIGSDWSEAVDSTGSLSWQGGTNGYARPSPDTSNATVIYVANPEPSVPDMKVTWGYGLFPGSGWYTHPAGVVARWQDSNNYYAVVIYNSESGISSCYLVKVVGGTATDLDSGTVSLSTSSTYEFEIRGDSLKFLEDGNVILEATDSSITSAGEAGLFAGAVRSASDDIGNTWWFDDFTVFELETSDFVVAPSGGDFTTIAAAYSAASCGDLIWVRDGTYTLTSGLFLNKNCTSGNELVIQNYPDESPKVTCSNPEVDAKRVNITGPYHVWDGIEIYSCYNGINLHASNVKILNSKIHNNILFGIVFVTNQGELSDIEIAGNTVELNGYVHNASTCTVGVMTSCTLQTLGGNPISAKNSHGVYLSNGNCGGIDGVHIHHNMLRHAGGRALQTNGSDCGGYTIENIVVEHNDFIDNSWGIAFFYGTRGVTLTDNTFSQDTWPSTNDTEHTFIGMWWLSESEINDNLFSSTSSSVEALRFYEGEGCPENDIDFNTWTLNSNDWMWEGFERSDFSTQYTNVSGCGANDTLN